MWHRYCMQWLNFNAITRKCFYFITIQTTGIKMDCKLNQRGCIQLKYKWEAVGVWEFWVINRVRSWLIRIWWQNIWAIKPLWPCVLIHILVCNSCKHKEGRNGRKPGLPYSKLNITVWHSHYCWCACGIASSFSLCGISDLMDIDC